MMKFNLSADPFEAARQAFFMLNADANDSDWECWLAKRTSDVERGFDDYRALAGLCRRAIAEVSNISPALREFLVYSGGVFEGLDQSISAIWLTMPVSRHAPKHSTRYRRQLAIGALQLAEVSET